MWWRQWGRGHTRVPEKRVSFDLLLADGNKQVDTAMTELTTALQPLLT